MSTTKTTTEIDLSIQRIIETTPLPSDEQFLQWCQTALLSFCEQAELTIRLVELDESARLNEQYRQKKGPTNILSFTDPSPSHDKTLYGDMVICAPLVMTEATAAKIDPITHWAHLVIHGCYHLLGYDHQTDTEAEAMQSLEIKALASLGIANPYADDEITA